MRTGKTGDGSDGSCLASSLLWTIIAAIVLSSVLPALAQAPALGGTGTVRAAEFKYYIWGSIRRPGMHMLGPETDITELLSAAGGPSPEASLSRIEIIRGIDRRVDKIDLKGLLESGGTVVLSPGDVVVVPEAFWVRVRRDIGLISSFATLLNLALLISRL